MQLFVRADDVASVSAAIDAGLPDTFGGWPTRYGWDEVPVSHHVEITTAAAWLERLLGFDLRRGVTVVDWLTTPQQFLLEVTSGAVFHDGLGELGPARDALAWYPNDVWLWLLACQWRRIDQEEAFVGRTAEVGDVLGSRLEAARLCRDVIRLCFLLERQYAPYAKWLGSAFARLDAAAEVGPALADALAAAGHRAREDALVRAYEAVARRHNALGVTASCDPTVRGFYSRPFRVLRSARFVEACLERIEDERLRAQPLVGSVDQLADSTDVLGDPLRARRASAFYE
jgi:hypothetical protein